MRPVFLNSKHHLLQPSDILGHMYMLSQRIPSLVNIPIMILCIPYHCTLHYSVSQLRQCSSGRFGHSCFPKQPQVLGPSRVAPKHVLITCGPLTVHCCHHQPIKVSGCLECLPVKMNLIFHRHIGTQKHCSTFVPMAANANSTR